MPGDPVTMMFANATTQVTPERIEAMKKLLGFVDGPWYVQNMPYMKSILSWELGTSIKFYPLSVNDLLGGAFGWSLFLAGTAVIISFSIGSILGIFAAWKRGSRYDASSRRVCWLFKRFLKWLSPCSPCSFCYRLKVVPNRLCIHCGHHCQIGQAGHLLKMSVTTQYCHLSVPLSFKSAVSWSTCVTT